MQVIPFQPPQQSFSGPFLGYGLLAVAARLIYKAIEKVDRAADSVADIFGDAAEELTTEATSAATLTIQLMKALAVVWFIANACRIVTRLVTGLRVVRAYAFRAAPADNQEYEQDSEVESEYMTHGPINLPPTPRLLFCTAIDGLSFSLQMATAAVRSTLRRAVLRHRPAAVVSLGAIP